MATQLRRCWCLVGALSLLAAGCAKQHDMIEMAPPPPPPVTTTGEAAPEPSPLYWNSWLSRQDWRVPVERAKVGDDYTVNFDLSAFDYAAMFGGGVASAPSAGDLRAEIAALLDKEPTLTLRYQPFILGHGLRFQPGEGGAGKLAVDLLALRASLERKKEAARTATPALFQQVFQDRVDAAKAARIVLPVTAVGDGCAAVGVSLWNVGLSRPLDYLVRYVPVGAAVAAGGCGPSGPSARLMTAGLSAMRSLESGGKADAAVHLFEMAFGQTKEAVAVFVGGDPERVLCWRPHPLSEYASASTGLADRLAAARRANDYTILGRELRQKLFFDMDGRNEPDEALAILRGLAGRQPAEPPATVFFRLVDDAGQSVFLPIGLLELGDNALLCDRATVVLPLPRERAHRPDRCVATWTMVLPDALGGVDQRFLQPIAGGEIPGRIRTWGEFSAYIAPSEGAPAPGGPEGLVLLAHHGDGRVSFAPGAADSLIPEGITRRFPPGSVAFLAACGVGDLSLSNHSLPLLSRINDRGIDGAVLSSFPVAGPVGARFAFHFADVVRAAQRGGERATLGQLFQRAVAATRGETALGRQRDEVLEFVVVGDADLALCGS